MKTTVVTVGAGRRATKQVIHTAVGRNPKQPTWPAHEHVTLSTPAAVSETQKLRALRVR